MPVLVKTKVIQSDGVNLAESFVFTGGNASEQANLGSGHDSDIARIVVQLVAAASWDGAVTVFKRVRGSGAAWAAAYYLDAGAVASAALSGTTLNKVIEIMAAGCEISIQTSTAGTVGSCTIYTRAVRG